jgi:hypothetical protein
MSDLRDLGERFLSNTCCRNFVFKIIKNPLIEANKEVSMAEFEDFE